MVGFQFDFANTKCSSCASHSHVFILGLILVCDVLSSHVRDSSVRCDSTLISLKYQHCEAQPDGVHDLDCFGKYKLRGIKTCKWKPGKHASEKAYTLIIHQQTREYCQAYINITNVSWDVTLYPNYDFTTEVFENGESANCTKSVFSGSPKSLYRCGPPTTVSLRRHSGRINVDVKWPQVDNWTVKFYSVRYKALGSLMWNESSKRSQDKNQCTVENLNSSLAYNVQIKCDTNTKCSQCFWSDTFTVPSELTNPPVIVNLKDSDIAEKKGRRLLILTWKFSATEMHDGYYVSVGKASGEAREQLNTTRPEIRLVLSYSAYQVNVSAFNNASVSPAASQVIPQREDLSDLGAGKLNVTVHSNTSFTIYWKDNLIQSYVCYSVEWMKKGHKVVYMPFFQNENNYRTLSPLREPLEPYERYSITLHTRPNKDTCNMKYVNNSESTYGSTQFYFTEGSPVSAPNISSYNITLNSVVLKWTSIPEEDIRGFLLGYIIHYTEYHSRGTEIERNITVDPTINSYKLRDLKSGTAYEVQISGFTQAGAGVRSKESFFTAHFQDDSYLSVITVLAVVAIVLIFGPLIINRAKARLWPSIPNPENSNAMQKIERPCELELLESINTLKVEEWDTNSLQIIEAKDDPASTLSSLLPLLRTSEEDRDIEEITHDWTQGDSEDETEDIPSDITGETPSDVEQTDLQTSTLAYPSGYTTMEMFQQGMPPAASAPPTQEDKPEEVDFTVVKSSLDYVRQFSTSPTSDNEEMSVML